NTQLAYGSGQWLSLIQGKPVLSQVINTCFEVKDSTGQPLVGSDKTTYIAKSLLKDDSVELPHDFIDLKQLICQRMAPA
ncbi:hypothetical protein LJC22_05325, partial [Desulfosarcina sp. OttesenSCG-928-G10]|nr:hypothetical protein [Desulfosarcina sp. OttesenSCG-928-G10]